MKMTTNELIQMIDEYFDGELENGEETILFISLSKNEEARNYFKRQHILKSSMQETRSVWDRQASGRSLMH